MIRHIFFDLDHTIWDFDRNAHETLIGLYEEYQLHKLGLHSATEFIERYTENNHRLWAQYHLGEISKDVLRAERFNSTFLQMGVHPEDIPHEFEEAYVNISPTKTHLFDGAVGVLEYLHKKYTLHIISNGFKEVTHTKIKGCNLGKYFKNIIISEEVGVNKPDKAIFEHALNLANTTKAESIMIGDSLEADIYGAQNFGIKAIYFNPENKPKPEDVKYQILHLGELMGMY